MPDETTTTTTTAANVVAGATTATAATATPADPAAAPQRPDYLPEKFWKDGAANTEALAKSYGELEKKLSTMRPHEVPESPDKYDFKPAELPAGVEWNDAAAGKFAAAFHANGVSTDAAKEIGRLFAEVEAENHAAIKAAYEQEINDGLAALKKEWGPAYNEKRGKVQSVVASLGYDSNDPALFANPKVVSFLGKVVNMLSEDSVASMRGAVAPGGTFANGSEEAHAIMMDAKHPDHAKYMEGDRTILAKVKRLIDG